MWQKERLLNLALAALPEGCGAVAWLDADVLFRDDDWPRAAVQALERAPLVQLFHRALYTGRGFLLTGDPSIIWDRPGLAAGIASGLAPLECLLHPAPDARPKTYATGLAWAARRDLLRRHGFYDANIIGGGDRALVCAALGCFDYEIKSHRLNARQTEHYLHWAKPFHADVGGMVGVIQGEILHLWHGDRANRGYGPRHRGLAQFDFDPLTDIAPDQGGVYRWASPKPNLHAFVADYFASRREDGQ
jgi:hypothetical protein